MGTYIGYWCTSDFWRERFVNRKEYQSQELCYGTGAYFFEDDHDAAHDWAESVKNYEVVHCIKAEICEEKVFDLVDKNNSAKYVKLLEDLVKRSIKEGSPNIPDIKNPYDCKFINFICEKLGYRLVRGYYINQNNLKDETKIHLCVKDKLIIKRADFIGGNEKC